MTLGIQHGVPCNVNPKRGRTLEDLQQQNRESTGNARTQPGSVFPGVVAATSRVSGFTIRSPAVPSRFDPAVRRSGLSQWLMPWINDPNAGTLQVVVTPPKQCSAQRTTHFAYLAHLAQIILALHGAICTKTTCFVGVSRLQNFLKFLQLQSKLPIFAVQIAPNWCMGWSSCSRTTLPRSDTEIVPGMAWHPLQILQHLVMPDPVPLLLALHLLLG